MGAVLGLMLCILIIGGKMCSEGIKNVRQWNYTSNYNTKHNYNPSRQSQVEIDVIANPQKYEEKLGHSIDRTQPNYYKKAAAEVLAKEGVSYDNGSRYQDSEYMRKAHGVKK